ncbi:AT-rich interactive domain-containing protein 5B [Acromyrmex echinatior]|uniref:AT-rich interactive domain-containing protein 5B n=1 Tax=Acromyrmex echinatior TaxID=103372 RepID=F4WN29_ACREC|nr:AT-rich interactive domain-containing protein 5B [Acromyrmex echinatior]
MPRDFSGEMRRNGRKGGRKKKRDDDTVAPLKLEMKQKFSGPFRFKLLGGACFSHGPYTFYKAVRISNGRVLRLGSFFLTKLWSDADLVSIGELQLLWMDSRGPNQPLASLRLYFLPENTPDGRRDTHGEGKEKLDVGRFDELAKQRVVDGCEVSDLDDMPGMSVIDFRPRRIAGYLSHSNHLGLESRFSLATGIWRVLGIRVDLCECSSACALCYDTVQCAVVLVRCRCNVVGMVGRIHEHLKHILLAYTYDQRDEIFLELLRLALLHLLYNNRLSGEKDGASVESLKEPPVRKKLDAGIKLKLNVAEKRWMKCPAWVWPHFRIEPFERARTRKRISSFAFDNHLPNEKHYNIWCIILLKLKKPDKSFCNLILKKQCACMLLGCESSSLNCDGKMGVVVYIRVYLRFAIGKYSASTHAQRNISLPIAKYYTYTF